MKILKKKHCVTIVLACLLACFLFAAWGANTEAVTDPLPDSDIEINTDREYVVETGHTSVPISEAHFDMNATYIYVPGY